MAFRRTRILRRRRPSSGTSPRVGCGIVGSRVADVAGMAGCLHLSEAQVTGESRLGRGRADGQYRGLTRRCQKQKTPV